MIRFRPITMFAGRCADVDLASSVRYKAPRILLSSRKCFFVVSVIAGACFLSTFALNAQNASNPKQVALQRWYQAAALPTQSVCTNSPGFSPNGLAFDGAHMWFACFYQDPNPPYTEQAELQEYNVSDNALLRTIPIAITNNSLAVNVLFDGANVWFADIDTPGTLTKVQASTGAILGTFTLPNYSGFGMAFDGTYVWIVGVLNNTDVISKVLATTGAVTTYQLYSCGSPENVVFDGSNIWISCWNGYTVQELNSSGAALTTIAVGNFPGGMAFDGTNIWVGNSVEGSLSRINKSTHVMTLFASGLCQDNYLAFDGKYLWVTGIDFTVSCLNGIGNIVNMGSKMLASTGAQVATFPMNSGLIAFDGVSMWDGYSKY